MSNFVGICKKHVIVVSLLFKRLGNRDVAAASHQRCAASTLASWRAGAEAEASQIARDAAGAALSRGHTPGAAARRS